MKIKKFILKLFGHICPKPKVQIIIKNYDPENDTILFSMPGTQFEDIKHAANSLKKVLDTNGKKVFAINTDVKIIVIKKYKRKK